ncbi:peptidase M16 [Candidatus Phycosocius spiralis]|uniref:Peptidase M16 n=1 Tax=Candidatus Phycosocius spiralis TaxID=2815099 RepID=A0ABQ4PS41_9PROT|nr:peptidase M16 [Candidatus Phycosocius spiralis]
MFWSAALFSLVVAFVPQLCHSQGLPIASTPKDAVWPWDGSDLKPDPTIVYGVLPNGMRYAIRVNKLPEKQVALRLRLDAGSKYERDDQRGFAHMIEHMAFNGSTNIPEGELTKTMERLGSSFGSHVNAHVNYNETMYKLDLPSADGGRLDKALSIFRETADRLLLKEEAIKREIGVVISELNDGEGPARRISRQINAFYFPNDRETLREPIGLRASVEGANSTKLREFYETWYRPERAILVISGDVDVEATKAMIAAKFSDWKAKTKTAPPAPDNGSWTVTPARALVLVEPEQPVVAIVNLVRPDETDYGELDTSERRAWWRLQSVAENVFSRRLASLQLVDNPPTTAVFFNTTKRKNGWVATLAVVPRDGDWKAGLKAVSQELRQALATGFTAEEIAEAIKDRRLGLERAIIQEPTRRTTGLVSSIVSDLGTDDVPTSPVDEKALFDLAIPDITPQAVHEAFSWWWRGVEPGITLITKQPIAEGETAVLSAWQSAMSGALEKREVKQKVEFKPLIPGPPGKMAKVEDLIHPKAKIVTFENGVRLIFHKTNYTKDRAFVRVIINAGFLVFPYRDVAWPMFAGASWSGDGIKDLTLDQAISVFAGRSTSLAGVSLGSTTLDITASPAAADLPEQVQLMLSQLIEPRMGPRPALLIREMLSSTWDSARLTAGDWFSFNSATFFETGHPMYDAPNLARILASDDAQGKSWLTRLQREGTIHIVVVGDVDFDPVVDAVAKTFGALPTRPGLKLDVAQLSTIRSVPTGQAARVLTHKGPAEQAIVHISWRTPGYVDRDRAEKMGALAAIMQLRLTDKVREASGKSYSPDGGWVATLYADLGRFYAQANVEPDQVKPIAAVIDRIAADLVRDGVSADELNRVIAPAVEAQGRARQNNGYWSSMLSELNTPKLPGSPSGYGLDREASTETRLKAITLKQLHEIAKRYLVPQNSIRIEVLPEKALPPKANAPKPKP